MMINGAQFHLLVNHLPVVGFIGATLTLIVAIVVTSTAIKKFVLGITVIAGLSALPAFWTGEPAEEVIEHLPGTDKALIHEHEEAAEFATILAVITGISAAGAFFLQSRKPESLTKTLPGVLILSLATAAAMAKTAHEGGKIRHSEIRGTQTAQP